MKAKDLVLVVWLIFVTNFCRELLLYCHDLREQNYTQNDSMAKMNEALSHLNDKIKSITSNRKQDHTEEEVKVEYGGSQVGFVQNQNDRSVSVSASVPFDDFHLRPHEEKTKTKYRTKNVDHTLIENKRSVGHVKIDPFRKLMLQSNFSDQHGSSMPEIEKLEARSDTATRCVLVEENSFDEFQPGSYETMFKLKLDVTTDQNPHETSWALLSHDRREVIIESMMENTSTSNNALSPNSLYQFEYECYVTAEDSHQTKTLDSNKEICYDFGMYDVGIFSTGGSCCFYGLGSFKVSINNDTAISDRLYGRELTASLCVDSNGNLINKKEKKNADSLYPSRACHNGRCICDSNPVLTNFEEADSDIMYGIKMNVIVRMMALSGSEKLLDVSTPQYKAACWTLNDDLFPGQQLEESLSIMSSRRIEQRMIQRYILSLFYFATSGQNWFNHYNFLSSRSECQWNSADAFYKKRVNFIGGSICDEDQNVISVIFFSNNLNGTIVDELFGLKKLEQLALTRNEYLYGTIPSSLGRLSELCSLFINKCSIDNVIPPELFNAIKLQLLSLMSNNLSGPIPGNIGNLQALSVLSLVDNELTGSIPDAIYSITNLLFIKIGANKFSGTISPLIGNLEKVESFGFGANRLTSTLPSTMKQLSKLKELHLDGNNFSGSFPNFLSSSPNLDILETHNNNFTGIVSDQICDMNMSILTADCKNDIFGPEVSCSCCSFCTDTTPVDGECADTEISVHVDHKVRRDYYLENNSDDMTFSLVEFPSDKNILSKGPFASWQESEPSYEVCVAYSQCISLVLVAAPVEDTNYTIFWNDNSIHTGTFLGYNLNEEINKGGPRQTMVNFWYDIEEKRVKLGDSTSCHDLQLQCDQEIIHLESKTTKRMMYDNAVKISGRETVEDPSSHQSRALCWILQDYILYNSTTESSAYEFIQRYVLTLLHLTSKDGIFELGEYPPLAHECTWLGVECTDSRNVTGITLSSSDGQIIDGTIIQEIGSLVYLEKLELKQTRLSGTIPHSFSNLWSMKKIDLSENSINGTIPDNLFRQLRRLEHIDLSDNLLSGSVNEDIGSYSPLVNISFSNNTLVGSLPFDSFTYCSLENFDVSRNQFSEIDFPKLLNHTKLKKLDLSANFFVGTLDDDMFENLLDLEYFDISKNEFLGNLPLKFPVKSNITHFDVHANRFRGKINDSISKLSNIQHLNLQGNHLTGSIPKGINELKQLDTLALSHNALKGSIPLNFNDLSKLKRIYLHSNSLSGEAPRPTTKVNTYITDCGVPSELLDPVKCISCTICCNSEGACNKPLSSFLKPLNFEMEIILSIFGIMIVIYIMKEKIVQSKCLSKYFSTRVSSWKASKLISERSIYHFFLTPNFKGWLVAFVCAVIQMATLILFTLAADTSNEENDMEYTIACTKNSLECEYTDSRSTLGYSIFAFLLAAWLLRDIIGSVRLFLLSLWEKKIDYLFASSIIFIVTLFSALTSIYYNLAIATKNTDVIVNAAILLFVNDIDEQLYQLAETCDVHWVSQINESLERNSYFSKRELLIHRSLHKMRKRFRSWLSVEKSEVIRDSEGALDVCVSRDPEDVLEVCDSVSENSKGLSPEIDLKRKGR